MFTLPIMIQEEDVGLFYALLAKYHADPTRIRRTLHDLQNDQPSIPKKESKGATDLYGFVTKNCTCGKCYNALLRNDRVPWRSAGKGSFINAKHGRCTISKSCQVHTFKGEGYIYETLKERNQRTEEERANKRNIELAAVRSAEAKRIEEEATAIALRNEVASKNTELRIEREAFRFENEKYNVQKNASEDENKTKADQESIRIYKREAIKMKQHAEQMIEHFSKGEEEFQLNQHAIKQLPGGMKHHQEFTRYVNIDQYVVNRKNYIHRVLLPMFNSMNDRAKLAQAKIGTGKVPEVLTDYNITKAVAMVNREGQMGLH